MNQTDLVTMLGNLGQSMASLQRLISGFGYLLGILFIMKALTKLKSLGERQSKESKFLIFAYFAIGAILLFLPSTISVLNNTTFGVGSVVQYASFSQFSLIGSMLIIIKTAGILWFVRGCVLLTHGSEPEGKLGTKGITFIIAGILAMNFQGTMGIITYLVDSIMSASNIKHPS